MGKHKNKKEWEYWFKEYELKENDFNWEKYFKTTKIATLSSARRNFRAKYRKYKKFGNTIITTMTGKKAKGRPKKETPINWDDFSREELIEIAKRYKEITKNKTKSEKHKESLRTEN